MSNESIVVPGESDEPNPWEELGLKPLKWLDEKFAPPVDRTLLEAYARGELKNTDLGEEILDLMAAFRSWNTAYGEVHRRVYAQGIRDEIARLVADETELPS